MVLAPVRVTEHQGEQLLLPSCSIRPTLASPLKHVTPKYIFGEKDYQRLVLKFSPQDMQIKTVWSAAKGLKRQRSQLLHLKYQSNLSAIYEQSQEYENAEELAPCSFMSAVAKDNQVFVTGGVDIERTQIYSRAFVFQETKGWKRLPNMAIKRALHGSIIMENSLFVIGGMQDLDGGCSSRCQRMSLDRWEWKPIASMTYARSSLSCFIYKKSIYVAGGMSSHGDREVCIQSYDPATDCWKELEFRLHRGIQCMGLIATGECDQLLLLGGCVDSGGLRTCFTINLNTRKYLFHSRMNLGRLFPKWCRARQGFVVFGGQLQSQLLTNDGSWVPVKLGVQVGDGFVVAHQSCQVPSREDQLEEVGSYQQSDRYTFLLGNQQQPFIFKLDLTKGEGDFLPVPMSLPLCSYMTALRLSSNEILVAGGLSDSRMKHQTFIYNLKSSQAKEGPPLPFASMLFSLTLYNQYIYLTGGITLDNQPSSHFYRIRTDFKAGWQKLPNIPNARRRHSTRLNPPMLYVQANGQESDVFDTITEQWLQPQIGSVSYSLRVQTKESTFIFGQKDLIEVRDAITGERQELSEGLKGVCSKLRRLGDPSLFSYTFVA